MFNALYSEKSIKGKPKRCNDTNHYKTFYPSVGNQKCEIELDNNAV